MSDTKKVWIDPDDCGLPTVELGELLRRQAKARAEWRKREAEESEQRRKDEAAKRQAQAPKAEVLPPHRSLALSPPDPKSLELPPVDKDAIALPDLSNLEVELKHAAKMMDLSVPEGRLDRWFGRVNHRIEVKTERGMRLAGYVAACATILVEAQRVAGAAGEVQRVKYQMHIDRLHAIHAVLESNYKLELIRENLERQNEIEEAKAKAIIAGYEAQVREAGLRGYLPPPPPPPPEPEPPVDEAAEEREKARRAREEERELQLDEFAEKSSFDQELVSRARKEALKIYHNENMEAGERFERICKILDSYHKPVTILPKAVREFMDEEEEASTL